MEQTPQAVHLLVFCAHFEPGTKGGGPIRSVVRILDTMKHEANLALVTRDRDVGDTEPYAGLANTWVPRGRAKVFYLSTSSVRGWLAWLRVSRSTSNDIVYVNSLFDPFFSIVPVLLVRFGVLRTRILLVAPRGEMSPGALGLKARKKRILLALWKPMLRRTPVIFHASTSRERAEILARFPGVDVIESADQITLDVRAATPVACGPVLRLVFISRISPKKNLLAAIEAVVSLDAGIHFDVYGPIEDADYWETCREAIAMAPASTLVRYRGEIDPALAVETFRQYDAFVFPTLGENFGHVIAESLAASCPVVCPDTTPWTEVLLNGGGLVPLGTGLTEVAAALSRLASSRPSRRDARRLEAGRAYERWRSGHPDINILDAALEDWPR